MTRLLLTSVLLFTLWGPLYAVDQWRMEEISFKSTIDYKQPFAECQLTATFTGPGGQKIIRPGFWDGDNGWKIRFAPTTAGSWKYITACSDIKNQGLHGKKGEVNCTTYNGKLDIYKHGFVGIGKNKHRLTHADGTPFLWMSDDHSFMDSEKWDSCNAEGCNSQFKQIAQLRMTQSFNVYSTVIWTVSNWKEMGKEPKLDYYKKMDRKIAHLADMGYVISFGLGYHKDLGDSLPNKDKVNATKLITRYIEARYGAYPVMYYTCGEFNIPLDGKSRFEDLFDRYWWGDIAKAIEKENSYHHPVSVNYWQPQGTWFAKETYFDFWTLQAYSLRDKYYYQYWYNYQPAKPLIDAWSGMDHNTTQSQDDQRKIAYLVMQSGGSGWGHLTEGIWNNCWKPNQCGCCVEAWGGAPWYNTITFAGAGYMTNAHRFYSSFKWHLQTPRFDDTSWVQLANPAKSVLTSEENNSYVAYFYAEDKNTGVLLKMDPKATYNARWYDPRNGVFVTISPNIKANGKQWAIPAKPDEKDWVLIVQKNM